MQKSKITILSTKSLDEEFIDKAKQEGISIEAIPFIKTEIISSAALQKKIEQVIMSPAMVAFTSGNAVEGVAARLNGQKPQWQIFCIGHATRQLVEKHFGKKLIAATADSAKSLAEAILKNNIDNLTFFCGDQRRDELPTVLNKHHVSVNEIVVYKTTYTSKKVGKEYEGILFFSPSAVKSFFQKNKAGRETILFTIGNTTADEIKKFSDNKIVIANEPDTDVLFGQMISNFRRNPIHH
ncbi:MAG TPA: uroporphyrinogen-III synthase [Chitinophagaceae bacterium]